MVKNTWNLTWAHRPQVPGASTVPWCFGEWQTSCGSPIARLCVWGSLCKKGPMNLAWHPLLLTPAYHQWTWRRAGSTTKFAPNGFSGFQIWKNITKLMSNLCRVASQPSGITIYNKQPPPQRLIFGFDVPHICCVFWGGSWWGVLLLRNPHLWNMLI